MAEEHIEFTLSLCVYVCVCVCLFQNRVRAITWLYMMGFENNMAQMIIMIRRCVANKNQVARSKVKVTDGTLTLCIDFSETCSCPTHNFVMHNGI